MAKLSGKHLREADRAPNEGEARAVVSPHASVFAPSWAVPSDQDAPRAWRSTSDRLAITRLASPNSVNSCPWFLASPL